MNTSEIEKLTRLASRLPVKHLITERCDSDHGEIYFAYGEGQDCIHGLWGYHGLARMLEFKMDASIENIRQVLVDDAAGFIDQLKERGVYG